MAVASRNRTPFVYWNGLYNVIPEGCEPDIVALPGDQTTAYRTTERMNQITEANDGDGIMVFPAIINAGQTFINVTTSEVKVYPELGQRFRNGSVLMDLDEPYTMAGETVFAVYCFTTGIHTIV